MGVTWSCHHSPLGREPPCSGGPDAVLRVALCCDVNRWRPQGTAHSWLPRWPPAGGRGGLALKAPCGWEQLEGAGSVAPTLAFLLCPMGGRDCPRVKCTDATALLPLPPHSRCSAGRGSHWVLLLPVLRGPLAHVPSESSCDGPGRHLSPPRTQPVSPPPPRTAGRCGVGFLFLSDSRPQRCLV